MFPLLAFVFPNESIENVWSGGIRDNVDSPIVVDIPWELTEIDKEFIVGVNLGICNPYKVLEDEDGRMLGLIRVPFICFSFFISIVLPLAEDKTNLFVLS